jgi:hypothetical protein
VRQRRLVRPDDFVSGGEDGDPRAAMNFDLRPPHHGQQVHVSEIDAQTSGEQDLAGARLGAVGSSARDANGWPFG